MNSYTYPTPLGEITLIENNGFLSHLLFPGNTTKIECSYQKSDLLNKANAQLQEYFSGERTTFDLPLQPNGTEFMHAVWQALADIPYGTTVSYKDIAITIDHPKAYRAVGMANNRNPLPIFIPCHRVIAANGKMCGYGAGIPIKEYLLQLERNNS